MYGGVNYRTRYGAQAVINNQFGYAGYGECGCVGENAGGVAVGGGYGAPIVSGSGALGDPYGLFGRKKKRKRKPNKFWNTVFDVGLVTAAFLNPAAIFTVPAALAVVGVRKSATTQRVRAEADVDQARGRKLKWKKRSVQKGVKLKATRAQLAQQLAYAQQSMGQGNIGTAAQEAPFEGYAVGVNDVTGEGMEPGTSPAVVAAVAVGTLLLGGTVVYALAGRKSRR